MTDDRWVMTEGVPLPDLRCPTCRSRFLPKLHTVDDNMHFRPMTVARLPRPALPPHIICTQGHKWTVIALSTNDDPEMVDAVQLGRYLGGGELIAADS